VAEERIRPVRTMQVFEVGGGRLRTFSGSAQAGVESRLSFKVDGTVSTLAVKVGDAVDPNDLISELDPEDYRLAVDRVRESLERQKIQARNAKKVYEDYRELFELNRVSRSDYDGARTTYESAERAVASAEKELQLADRRLDYTRLAAPAKGVVASVPVEVNENVMAGQTIVILIAESKPEVTVSIPEAFISLVERGSPVTVVFDAIPGESFPATVTEPGVTTGRQSATYPVTVQLDEDNQDVRSGMAAEVTFSFERAGGEERILVPPFAVSEDRLGRCVYVVEAGGEEGIGVVRRKSVQVGELTEGGLEIISGIEDGEVIVTAGVSKMFDGLKVKLLTGEVENR
jgi:RND family efflux transporter MFP subunit